MLRSFLSDIYFLVSSKVEFILQKKKLSFHHIINPLLTELVRSRLLNTGLCSFYVFIVLEFSAH